jgi:hypothetical protein
MAGRIGRRAAEVKSIAAAAKPFYDSLDDTQKRNFTMLGREMLTAGDGPLWHDSAGDAGGTWLPAHWDWKQ